MQLFSIEEIIENYTKSTVKKCEKSVMEIASMAFAAGLFIALAGLSASLASCSIDNDSVRRLVSGLIFPFGLGIIMVLECQLFTGNCMMVLPLIKKKISIKQLLRNFGIVYAGNFMGAMSVACAVAYLDIYQSGSFGICLVNTALVKCQKQFLPMVVMGILCNLLVCTGVLLSMSAKDTVGRILGAYIPVSIFIISGFEHCVANMFYIPAALLLLKNPVIAGKAVSIGTNISALTWQSFLVKNLIPVTLGNVIGGILLGMMIWIQEKNS